MRKDCGSGLGGGGGGIKGICVILYFKSVIREVFYKMYVLCSIEIKLCKKKKKRRQRNESKSEEREEKRREDPVAL